MSNSHDQFEIWGCQVMIRSALISAAVLAIPFSLGAQEASNSELTVGSFSARPDSGRNAPMVEVEMVLVIQPGNVRHLRLDRTVTDRQGTVASASADSRTCSAVKEQMAKVETLPVPSFAAPGSDKLSTVPIVLHPTSYKLAMRGYESGSNTTADLELGAQSGSPLAQWTEETLEALEPCWSRFDS